MFSVQKAQVGNFLCWHFEHLFCLVWNCDDWFRVSTFYFLQLDMTQDFLSSSNLTGLSHYWYDEVLTFYICGEWCKAFPGLMKQKKNQLLFVSWWSNKGEKNKKHGKPTSLPEGDSKLSSCSSLLQDSAPGGDGEPERGDWKGRSRIQLQCWQSCPKTDGLRLWC